MKSVTKENLCAVVVWYNPKQTDTLPITFYADHVKRVFVVDNSEVDNNGLLQELPHTNITYLPQHQNTGIASALNVGCRAAIEEGCDWILTMDQDSKFNITSFADYIKEANVYLDENPTIEIGILTPFTDCDGQIEKHHRRGRFESCFVVMASGNLLSVDGYLLANGFRDEFFIDSVDDELCCHLHQLNKQIIRLNNIILNHRLGEGAKKLLGSNKTYIPHPAWRYFYIARNLRKMIVLYPEYKKIFSKRKDKYIKRLFLYDWDDKCAKLTQFYKGWNENN